MQTVIICMWCWQTRSIQDASCNDQGAFHLGESTCQVLVNCAGVMNTTATPSIPSICLCGRDWLCAVDVDLLPNGILLVALNSLIMITCIKCVPQLVLADVYAYIDVEELDSRQSSSPSSRSHMQSMQYRSIYWAVQHKALSYALLCTADYFYTPSWSSSIFECTSGDHIQVWNRSAASASAAALLCCLMSEPL